MRVFLVVFASFQFVVSLQRYLQAPYLPNDSFALPAITNGYVGTVAFSESVYLSGVYNGAGTLNPSHRARIPAFINFEILNMNVSSAARDLQTGAFFVRFASGSRRVELFLYAHRSRRNLLVATLTGNVGTINVRHLPGNDSIDFTTIVDSSGEFRGQTIVPEYPVDPLVNVTAIYTPINQTLQLPCLLLLSASSTREDANERTIAVRAFNDAVRAGADALWAEHESAWQSVWNDARIEVDGDAKIATAVNASLASLLAEVRVDWPIGGLSVGGAATSGQYHGHVFSDAETWMGPALQFFYPQLVRAILRYRLATRDGARQKAASYANANMDERTFNVSNDAYTNAAAAISLEFCVFAAKLLGRSVPASNYLAIANKLPVLIDPSLNVHLSWLNYNASLLWGGLPVLMLGHPILYYPMSSLVRTSDVLYYGGARTTYKYAPFGMANAMNAIAYFDVGLVAQATAMFDDIYGDFLAPFLVPVELPQALGYGQQNFVTSCGGYLQALLYGYLGLRAHNDTLAARNALLPGTATSIALHGVKYRQSSLRLAFNASGVCATLLRKGTSALRFNGQPLKTNRILCSNTNSFEIM